MLKLLGFLVPFPRDIELKLQVRGVADSLRKPIEDAFVSRLEVHEFEHVELEMRQPDPSLKFAPSHQRR